MSLRREASMLVKKVTLAINTGCTKGDLLTNGAGAGFTPAVTGSKRPFALARETVVAPSDGTQSTCMAIVEGHSTFNKGTVVGIGAANALAELMPFKAFTTGKVVPAIMGTDTADLWAGYAWEPAISGATTCYGVMDQ